MLVESCLEVFPCIWVESGSRYSGGERRQGSSSLLFKKTDYYSLPSRQLHSLLYILLTYYYSLLRTVTSVFVVGVVRQMSKSDGWRGKVGGE